MKRSRQSTIAVLISGNGSNLQAIIDATKIDLPADICAVISNQPDAFGIERAKKAGIPNHIIPHRNFPNRHAFEEKLREQIDAYQPEWIVLAGFMRRLTPDFIAHYKNRIINIHPSLLPKYPGLHTHRKVLEAGDSKHGISIHYVTDEVDGGPLIFQASLDVNPDDTEDTLKQRIQKLEHRHYPEILKQLIYQRI